MLKPRLPSLPLLRDALRWALWVAPVAAAIGALVALFLWLLDQATALRLAQPWLLWLLPLAGIGIVLAYQRWGGRSDQGNNLVLDEIHQPDQGVPLRLAPFVLLA